MYYGVESRKVASVYSKLKELVVDFQFRPGEHLHINELSATLKVSVTPVREALIRLTDEGLITTQPNRGFFTKVPDLHEIDDLYGLLHVVLRSSLEARKDDFVAAPPSGEDPAMAAPEASRLLCIRLERLHEQIARISLNRELVRLTRQCNERTRYVRLVDCGSTHAAEIREQIEALTGALDAGSMQRAIHELDRLLYSQRGRLTTIVREIVSGAAADV
ncbi:GntR family transcriptional regulator [Inquilinus limosus]|uniref:GntR family transcriptional regulator n=1 Tax=Inquilinus limosus TaxID=171674 RepID=UPI0003FEC542|nr:GntR family transcriptional regulator [Inquilinus limosus]